MICIILRNIDAEANDYDLLLYCYLKVWRWPPPSSKIVFIPSWQLTKPIDCQPHVASSLWDND